MNKMQQIFENIEASSTHTPMQQWLHKKLKEQSYIPENNQNALKNQYSLIEKEYTQNEEDTKP
jgi:hypothetical protein